MNKIFKTAPLRKAGRQRLAQRLPVNPQTSSSWIGSLRFHAPVLCYPQMNSACESLQVLLPCTQQDLLILEKRQLLMNIFSYDDLITSILFTTALRAQTGHTLRPNLKSK